jgi:hypothetical protein
MRVILPWTVEHPEVLAALEGWPVERVYVGSDDEAYFRLISDLWHSGDTFTIVEHDNVPAPGILREFEVCPSEWCAEPYWLAGGGGWGCWFGVVRFRGSLTARYPDLPESIQRRDWRSLDSAVINHLRMLGPQEPHRHWPPAIHLRSGWDRVYNCNSCGAALAPEDIIRGPAVDCRNCGTITSMPVPSLTMTDDVW